MITLHERLPRTDDAIPNEVFIKVISSFLPDHWHIEFDPEFPEAKVKLLSPEKRSIHLGVNRSYNSAILIARNLKNCVRERV